jgi:hypothetical protein
MLTFKARSIFGNGYPDISFGAPGFYWKHSVTGESNSFSPVPVTTYDDRAEVESFPHDEMDATWKDYQIIISPTGVKFDRNLGNNFLNSFQFQNTSLYDVVGYGNTISPFSTDELNKVYTNDSNGFGIRFNTSVSARTPYINEVFTSQQIVIQYADFGLYEVNPEIFKKIIRLDPDNNVYLQIDGEQLRVTAPGTEVESLTYKPIMAGGFITGSHADYKDNIQLADGLINGSEVVKNLDFFKYHLKVNLQQGIYDKEKLGLILEEVQGTLELLGLKPSTLIDGDGIDLYSFASILGISLKDEIQKNEQMKRDIAQLYEVINLIQGELTELKGA